MNTHTATLALLFGQEVSFGTIAGPVDFIDVYVDGNSAPNAIVEWRLYATVGTLTSLVATSTGGGKKASVLKWQGAAGAYSPIQADGSVYELRGYWAQQGSPPTMKASIVGYDEFDTATASGSSSVQTVPVGFGEVTFASAAGYSQFADAAVEQNFRGNVLFILYALSEGGGVEAPIDTQLLSSEDGTTRIFASLKLPGATSYRLAAQDPTGAGGQAVKASLACYSALYSALPIPPIPPSALVPGPQLTVLRSVVPTAPTSVVWASTGYVDFVADCGADPTGVADCAPAFDRAAAILIALAANPHLPETALTLFFPPGVYTLRSAPATAVWNFGGFGTSITLQGCGNASIIQFEGFSGPTIANAYRTYMRDLTCTGSLTAPAFTLDCAECFQFNTTEVGAIERCTFYNLFVSSSCIQLSGQLWAVRECTFSQTACSAEALASGAVLWAPAAQGLTVENCYFEDISRLNGYAPGYNKVAANRLWVRFDGLAAGGIEQNPIVEVKGCVFDEGCTYAIWVKKQAAGPRIHYVRLEGNYFNPPIHYSGSFAGPTACVHVEGVDVLVIDGMINSGFTATAPGPAIECIDVTTTRVRGLQFNDPAAQSDYVVLDAACKYFRLEDSPTVVPANIFDNTAARSLAKTNELKSFGTDTMVECDVKLAAAGGAAIGNMLKVGVAANTYALLGVADGVGLAAGVSLDAVAGGAVLRSARRGQVVTVLSDGTTAIAIGDPITNLGAGAPGQVKKAIATGTTPIIGVATSAVASGGGAVLFDMLFQTGEA